MGQKYKVFGQSFFLSLWDKTWYKMCQKFPSIPRENLRKLALFTDISKKSSTDFLKNIVEVWNFRHKNQPYDEAAKCSASFPAIFFCFESKVQ
jgi:hypothetical protein